MRAHTQSWTKGTSASGLDVANLRWIAVVRTPPECKSPLSANAVPFRRKAGKTLTAEFLAWDCTRRPGGATILPADQQPPLPELARLLGRWCELTFRSPTVPPHSRPVSGAHTWRTQTPGARGRRPASRAEAVAEYVPSTVQVGHKENHALVAQLDVGPGLIEPDSAALQFHRFAAGGLGVREGQIIEVIVGVDR